MDVEVDQAELLLALGLCQAVAERRNTGNPMLGTVLLRGERGRLVCSATDLLVGVSEELLAETAAPGALCLDGKWLLQIVRTLPGEPLRLTRTENHWARLTVGRATFRLMGHDPAQFPPLPKPKTSPTSLAPQALAQLVRGVQHSICADEARVGLAAVLLESDGAQTVAVSTDGHRLTRFSQPLGLPAGRYLLPRRSIQNLLRTLDRSNRDVAVAVSREHWFLSTQSEGKPGVSLSIKLADGAFPPYDRIVPSDLEEGLIRISYRELHDAVTRATSVMTSESPKTIRVRVESNAMHIAASNPDLGTTSEEVECTDAGHRARVVALNARYLLDALDVLHGETAVRITIRDDTSAVTVQADSHDAHLSVIMPVRLQDAA